LSQLWKLNALLHMICWLVIELECNFQYHELMNAFGAIYLKYWLQQNCESTFVTCLDLIKQHYYTPKKLSTSCSWVSKSL
jgi:hypothetical protein